MIKHVWLGLAVLLAAGRVHGQEATQAPAKPAPSLNKSEESQLTRLLADRRDPQGRRCELRGLVAASNLRYLACGEAGVWVVRVMPGRVEVVEQRPTSGHAGAFFLRDGTLWVEIQAIQAERLAPVSADASVLSVPPALAAVAPAAAGQAPTPPTAGPEPLQPPAAGAAAPSPAPVGAPETPGGATALSAPPAAAAQPQAAPPAKATGLHYQEFAPVEAHVVGVEPGFAIIDMGSEHGVAPNDHVSFEQLTQEQIDADNHAVHRERVAVGNASTIGEKRTRVALGIGERVEVGATALPTRDPLTSTTFSPPRLGGLWHVGFMARPFLVIDNFGVGGLLEARAGYRWQAPIHVEAVILPLAVGTGREGVIGAGAAIITGSYDSKFFEAGLGAGGQSVGDPAFDLHAGTGTTLAQRLRIGALDGGMFEVFSYIVLFHSEFEFSDLQVHGQLPVGERTWITVSGGGGAIGAGFGEIGVRVLLSGNGDRGSSFLSATIGGTHVFRSRFCTDQEINCRDVDYTGPHAGIGAEFRL